MKAALLFLALACVLCASRAQSSGVSDERFARLAKGVNLSHWYAQSQVGYAEKHLSSYFTIDDVRLIRDMGFTHVRLTLNETVLFDSENPGQLRREPLQRFDERLKWFRDHHIAVIVDLHPGDEYKMSLLQPAGAEAFEKDWAALAEHLAGGTDPGWVFLEILNEPHKIKGEEWQQLQGSVLMAIRKAAPQHTVILTGGEWGGVADLLKLKAYDDQNVVYTFHWYGPFMFTHQAAEWGWSATRHVKNLGWPIDPGQADAAAAAATENKESAGHLRHNIQTGQFAREWLSSEFEKVRQWAKEAGSARIYAGEYGVYKKAAPPEARLQWYEACRREFEQRGWGWAIWDYSGGFSVAPGKPGTRAADEQLLNALGIRTPAAD